MAKSISCKADVGGKSKEISISEALAGMGENRPRFTSTSKLLQA
jgi:hypothetical protein